jgi:2'-5' RNA ligase
VLPEDPRDRLVDWQRRELGQVEGIRIVPPDNLHVTIAFLGARPAADVEPILALMRDAAAPAQKPLFTPIRYRETRSVGMVVCEDAGDRGSSLADDLFARLEKLGVYRRERRRWLPHVTVLRFRGRPPRLAPTLPVLGGVSPSEVALYHSVLRPSGAQYEIVESVALGG